jgi:hypothetical protein
VIVAGALGRLRAHPDGWDGEYERQLALELLSSEAHPTSALAKLARQAKRILPEQDVAAAA